MNQYLAKSIEVVKNSEGDTPPIEIYEKVAHGRVFVNRKTKSRIVMTKELAEILGLEYNDPKSIETAVDESGKVRRTCTVLRTPQDHLGRREFP